MQEVACRRFCSLKASDFNKSQKGFRQKDFLCHFARSRKVFGGFCNTSLVRALIGRRPRPIRLQKGGAQQETGQKQRSIK